MAKQFGDIPAFKGYWQFNPQEEQINGSGTFWNILLNKSLGKQGLWLPTYHEARDLDTRRKLTNRFYRVFGIVFSIVIFLFVYYINII